MKIGPTFSADHRSGGTACGGRVTSVGPDTRHGEASGEIHPACCNENTFDSSWFRKSWFVIEGDKITEFVLGR